MACPVLLVEDDPHDMEFIRETLAALPLPPVLHITRDGSEAIDFILQRGEHTEAPRPHLILLDLRLPRQDGFEVLRIVKSDPACRNIPVVVLTASKLESDTWHCYHLYANAYVEKPAESSAFAAALHATVSFYCDVTVPPPHTPPTMYTSS